MMGWYGPGMGGSGYALMVITAVLFWALMVAAIVTLVRLSTNRSGRPGSRSARQMLDERYARGEIDDEEYQRRLRLLAS
jgi:putative membrane protein